MRSTRALGTFWVSLRQTDTQKVPLLIRDLEVLEEAFSYSVGHNG
jgi:hypothetical protein